MTSSASSRHPHLQPTFVETAFNSVLNPGVGSGTFGVLNGILAALLVSILGMWLLGLGGQHLYVLCALTVGLLASINWFSKALIDNKPAADEQQPQSQQQQQQERPSEDDEPPARRTRSRSRAKDEERSDAARPTRSSANKDGKDSKDSKDSTVSAAGSKKRSQQAK